MVGLGPMGSAVTPLAPRPVRGDRRRVVDIGHDDELGVLWLRLDLEPSEPWCAVFDAERAVAAVELACHGRYVLCTATRADRRRVEKAARRLVGTVNGAVAGPSSPERVGPGR